MADISLLARLLNGAVRQVDLSQNALVVGSLKVGSVSPTELTKTILDNLITLQNGSDISASLHHHDNRYFTETELGSATASSGSDLIGDDNTYSNFTPAAATVKGALSGIDSALAAAASNDFSDAIFRISDNGDNTKKIAFEASGIATATVRTITMPDANVSLADVNNAILKDGSRAFTANQPMGGFKLTGLAAGTSAGDSVRYEQAILTSGANAFAANQSFGGFKATNLGDPTSAQDAATKAYVDQAIMGVKPKQACRVATTANISLATDLENGDSIDGITLATGDRVLVKDQSTASQNGIYIVQASGAAVRATDFDSLSPVDEINGAWVGIQVGTANGGKVFIQYGTVTTIDTDPINFTYFSDLSTLVGGDMITISGSTVSVDLAAVSGLESSNPGNAAGQLRVKLAASNPGLRITGSNELDVKYNAAGAIIAHANGITVNVDGTSIEISSNALRIASGAAGNGIGYSAGVLSVNVDDSTIEINTDTVRVKDAGITSAKLNTNAFDQSTITGGAGSSAAVQNAPLVKKTMVAGESFAANTSFIVRFALNGETAGRVYKADKDTSSTNKYYGIGIALSTGAVSAGQNISVTMIGTHILGAGDASFGATDIGKEVFLTASGAFSLTAPSAANEAVWVIGVVENTDRIFVDGKSLRYIN